MTKFPELPKFDPIGPGGGDLRVLAQDHYTEVGLFWGLLKVKVLLKAGFVTDGASIPEDYQKIAGGPWSSGIRVLAAVVHDGLYQLHWAWRWLCDRVYLAILLSARYSRELAEVEYAAIRAAGWRNWSRISKQERQQAKGVVVVSVGGVLS